MTQPDTKPQQNWRERFRALVNEVESELPERNEEGEIHYFGQKVNDNDTLWVIQDWAHIEAFISTERTNVLAQVKALVEGMDRHNWGGEWAKPTQWVKLNDILAALNKLEAQNE